MKPAIRRRILVVAPAISTIMVLTSTVVFSAPIKAGDLDTQFGAGKGTVTTALYPGEDDGFTGIGVANRGEDVLVQPDGKILVAGWTNSPVVGPPVDPGPSPSPCPRPGPCAPDPGPPPGPSPTAQDFVLIRYLPDGTLDTSLAGGTGFVVVPVAPGEHYDAAYSIARQPNGMILMAGVSDMGGTGSDFSVVRFNPDGTLDATFDGPSGNGNGKVTIAVGPGDTNDVGRDVAVLPDNDIVIVGDSAMGPPTNHDFSVVRLNSDGTLDQSFDGNANGNGKVTFPVGPGGSPDTAQAVAIHSVKSPQPKPNPNRVSNAPVPPRIVIAGYSFNGGFDFAVVRLTSTGLLDINFNGTGIAITAIGPSGKDDQAFDVLVHSGGKVVAVGMAVMPYPGGDFQVDFALVRYKPNGKLDTTFSGDGIKTTRFPAAGSSPGKGDSPSWAKAAVRQPDGKYVLGGFVAFDPAGEVNFDYALARYHSDGQLDTSFGIGGKVWTGITPNKGADEVLGIALQPDGKIVAAGGSDPIPDTGLDHSVARYHEKAQ